MNPNAQKFIQLLEKKETWGFKAYGDETFKQAERYAGAIMEDVYSASTVPVNTWVVFVALLPFGRSISALSDLTLVLPRIIQSIVLLDQETTNEVLLCARHVVLERLNILVRRDLHNHVLTQSRNTAIKKALGQINGYYKYS